MVGARGCAALLALVGLLILPQATPVSRNTEIVQEWAEELGEELWRLTVKITNIEEIKRKYVDLHIKVRRKNETSILNSAVGSVSLMLQRKIDAVKCIHHQAEELARKYSATPEERKNFTYCSSKYSNFLIEEDFKPEDNVRLESDPGPDVEPEPDPGLDGEAEPDPGLGGEAETTESEKDEVNHYVNITLNPDSHFYDIAVDTDHSCVQVPTNIYDQEADALEAILWSEQLDETFRQNYESDPSLSWQYFGSSTGILRLFPGMPWQNLTTDVFDCRVRSWYIEAATCSKDVIILFDVSGSMTGFRNYVARATLKTLLETLSNNDFINVYTFKNETREAVGCFTDLVQATPENLKTITDELEPTENGKKHKVPLEGYANLTTAYITAFEKLKIRRQNCSTLEENQGCNQLVMLITDNVPGNLTEVFDNYNRERVGNETRIPVRVFTYLIGKEVTNVREIQWMACLNRGYYVHIHSIEEVQQQVLKYINVIARPMILEGAEPPPTWTHAYIDETRTNEWGVSKEIFKPDADKLVTSVAIPAFKFNENSNVTRAELLGVAGTDVPIDSITKLAQPHQLGVNGYSFIVSNNGYLLLHPSLVPSIDGRLQLNLNSVDIVEVEQVDDGLEERQLGDEILRLRSAMVNGESGHLMNVPVLFHYDKMRRIAQVKQNYFYNKLEGTPFSLGISLPEGYGNTYLDVEKGDLWEVDWSAHSGVKITQYFNSSYRVHPDWVYCKYHYQEGHEMETQEKEVWHFLRKMNEEGWKWSEQYSNDTNSSQQFSKESHCTQRAKLDKNDYYCNRDLVEMLVFDAKLTDDYFKKWAGSVQEVEMAKLYNVSVRFVSTSSGLTRWNYLFDDARNEFMDDYGNRSFNDPHRSKNDTTFGDMYPRAIEEIWYMSAVLQHVISDDTLVVAVNFTTENKVDHDTGAVNKSCADAGLGNETCADAGAGNKSRTDDITVTASYAIFARQQEEESPASVVGVQFHYANWRERFKRITQHTHIGCEGCIERCDAASGVACYLVDSSGYVVMAEDPGDVGKFFGARQPYVLRDMRMNKIFKKKTVYDYQALCGPEDLQHNSSAGSACRLATPLSAVQGAARWLTLQLAWLVTDVLGAAAAVLNVPEATTTPPPSNSDSVGANSDDPEPDELLFSCDKKVKLYILQPEELKGGFFDQEPLPCTPRYTAVAVKHTNLVFVALDFRKWEPMSNCSKLTITTDKIPTRASTQSKIPCHKLELGGLERRRLEGCYTYHKKEAEIDACGEGSLPRQHLAALLAALLAAAAVRPLLLP